MVKQILQKEETILREKAIEVPIENISSSHIKNVITEMSEALKTQEDGVAIAAPQIGYSLRIFLVSGKVFEEDFIKNRQERIADKSKKVIQLNPKGKDLVFINPKILKLSKKRDWMPEGCLSVRPYYGKTNRATKALVEAYDENGVKFTRGGSGLLAQIFQHEIDHLEGILFIDHAKDVIKEKIPTNE